MDPNERLHQEWLGMAQPEGLVVTVATLKAAEANITWPVVELQATLRELAGETRVVLDLPAFFRDILGWSDEYILPAKDTPDALRVSVDGGEPLVPAYAVRSADDDGAFVLLVGQPDKLGGDLDAASDDKRWTATPHQRFERLLRETGVHVGLLTNGKVFRLVYAPKGETAGWVTFRLHDMLSVDGRPLLGALHMLLNERRLLALEPEKRLAGLLKASREYQNTVSNTLREQVLAALRELLVGFQHADRLAHGTVLGDYRRGHLDEIYKGLVTVLMRCVFVLFAEEKNLLPVDHPLYAESYSLTRLYAQLVTDRDRYGDTQSDRYGAWARIVSLFRLLHDGVRAADGLYLPARRGDFFNPDAFPFLEGRGRVHTRQAGETLDLPRVSDGVVLRVLDRLIVLGGERLQYKGLDVEQVGSVYEGLMGFEVEVAEGPSLCLTPEHVVVNLEALLAQSGAERVKTLKATASLDLKDKAAGEVRDAKTLDALQAALARRNSTRQPGLIAAGSLYLQPGEERRKSGSHYTPKSLTAPIVETTLRPVLERLGAAVTPEQLLDLKICDPAMGSAAFLVEACRQLADHLVAAWRRTGTMPELPQDEDPVLHARRLIAQRCLYGVDKNPLAVDLARLSMWLVTFAKEHPFTFVDHALRCGDTLVGLSKEQIASLTLDVSKGAQVETVRQVVFPAVKRAEELRRQIHAIGDPPDTARLVELWDETKAALRTVRMLGDLVVASFFAADSDKARAKGLAELAAKVTAWLATGKDGAVLDGMVADLHAGEKGVTPFHWEIEFPEVFARENPGFDCFVGNPPFLGGHKVWPVLGESYRDWITTLADASTAKTDLVAHFFRRAFAFLRPSGCLGLVATNSIAQGDTRAGGLSWICGNGGTIYDATRRRRWPGAAAVVISVVHIVRDRAIHPCVLDGAEVPKITAYLFHKGGSDDPGRLIANSGKQFRGCMLYGQGFAFDDSDPQASPIEEMHRLVATTPRNQERIFPYIGGEEVNSTPTHMHVRYVINFEEMTLDEAARWPELLEIVKTKVRPLRSKLGGYSVADGRNARWWLYGTYTPALYRAVHDLRRVLVLSRVSASFAFTFLPRRMVFSEQLVVFPFDDECSFATLQSRVHEGWARFFSSSMKDDLRYTPSDCFETFPFPPAYESSSSLEHAGETYYAHRAALMIANNEGLTKTYNRFHNPDERSPGIQTLRDLHAQMDRAVLDAYGWTDILPIYDFREQLDESIRLTWGEDTRDEVLARLLELNRVMAAKEAAEAGTDAAKGGKTKAKRAGKKGKGGEAGAESGQMVLGGTKGE
jgi:hypothetical protein